MLAVMLDVVAPVDQRYVPPPLAVRTTELPLQKVVGPPAEIEAVSCGFTVTFIVVMAAQATDGVKV